MKKLKIFLMLSILLCLGFALSSEVHAQGGGPKIFEVDDVLPATTQLRISWVDDIYELLYKGEVAIRFKDNQGFSRQFIYIDMDEDKELHISLPSSSILICHLDLGYFESPYTNYDGNHPYIDIDTSTWDINRRTITAVEAGMDIFTWEDLNAPQTPSGPKPFEIGDELPAGYIKISWDFTDKFNDIIDYDVTFWVAGDGDPENTLYIEIEVWDYGEEVRFSINQEEFHIDTPGEIVISIPIPYTIVQIDASEGYDYYDSIGNTLLWEVVTEEEFIYNQAYQEGYSDGYYLGYKHAREIYGYYDPKTDEWLSVTEYLNRYGTDKMGQSDFYNNFDKYFIPAMIIVFGGAIVLTILKVFKGRE